MADHSASLSKDSTLSETLPGQVEADCEPSREPPPSDHEVRHYDRCKQNTLQVPDIPHLRGETDQDPRGSQRAGSKRSAVSNNSYVIAAVATVAVVVSKVDPLTVTVMLFGAYLACCAGTVNAISFYALGSFTSHVTGTWTKVGMNLETGAFEDALRNLLLMVSFILGAMLSGCMIPKSNVLLGYAMYGWALVGNALLLLAAVLLHSETFLAACLTAAACGLQNGMITSYSGAIIRTTHITGLATDVGLILGRSFVAFLWRVCAKIQRMRQGRPQEPLLPKICEDSKKLMLLLLLAGSFLIGTVFGVLLFRLRGIDALLVPAGTSALAGLSYTSVRTCFYGRPVFDVGNPRRSSVAAASWLTSQLPDALPRFSRSQAGTDEASDQAVCEPPSGENRDNSRLPSRDPPTMKQPLHSANALRMLVHEEHKHHLQFDNDVEYGCSGDAIRAGGVVSSAEDVLQVLSPLEVAISGLPLGDGSQEAHEAHAEALQTYHRLLRLLDFLAESQLDKSNE